METEPILVEARIRIPYRWPAGRVAGRFLELLRDEGRLAGLRCPRCRKVAVPPRPRCLACRVASEDWVPVGPGGAVTSWTRTPDGVLLALVRLDGADTAILHRLLEVKEVHEGMRVSAVFAGSRAGQITDLAGFRP